MSHELPKLASPGDILSLLNCIGNSKSPNSLGKGGMEVKKVDKCKSIKVERLSRPKVARQVVHRKKVDKCESIKVERKIRPYVRLTWTSHKSVNKIL